MKKVSIQGKKLRPVLVVPADYPDGSIQLVALAKSKALLEPVNSVSRHIFGT